MAVSSDIYNKQSKLENTNFLNLFSSTSATTKLYFYEELICFCLA
jgi:hypothetical protein